jgi:nicotinamidase/pyrazinamidase
MVSKKIIFWEVDAQEDFMTPSGKLYVPGAEKLLHNIRRLTDAARQGRVLLVSHGCIHTKDDPEFAQFPPHCIQETPGARLVPEALTEKYITVRNDPAVKLPADFEPFHQILLEKQTLDIFESHHAEALLDRLPRDAEFIVFGVVTEYCVRLAAKGLLERGRRVAVVSDAIETLNPAEARRTMKELTALGAETITTNDALRRLEHTAAAEPKSRAPFGS